MTGEGISVKDGRPNGSVLSKVRAWLLELPRPYKRAILVLSDFVLLSLAVWLPLCLRFNMLYVPPRWETGLLVVAGPLITIATFASSRLYKFVTRFLGHRGQLRVVACVWFSVLIWSLLVFMSGQLNVPRSVIIAYGVLGSLFIVGSRAIAAMLLEGAGITLVEFPADSKCNSVVIYGAGQLGVQLLSALQLSPDRHVVAFVDSERSLWRQYVGGLKVYPPDRLSSLISDHDVREVLIALPDGRQRERRRILRELQTLSVATKVLPAVEEFAAGSISVNDLRPLDISDLLGRERVPAIPELLSRSTTGKSILVTGAGGSVGSELVRQLAKQDPARIVLFDNSEAALYEIDIEVRELLKDNRQANQAQPEIVTILGSVLDATLVRETIANHNVATIYHAAAYKHVPIVEKNAVYGLRNNTFGAAIVAESAKAEGVELMVLISTDKAVRPTSIMGASKRLAELVLQSAAGNGGSTVFAMVRFGNVLDSSGSVVQRFREQIRAGGPVTVTHRDVLRYFMSIPEAAELVIQAGAMASGGELFVLDMGEPVKIDDLARLMIRLSGLEVISEDNPDGDIEITYTGLRPGEKLSEELLIGTNAKVTEHPRIMHLDDEPELPPAELARELERLKGAMTMRDMDAIQAMLAKTVEGYRPGAQIEGEGDAAASAAVWSTAVRTLH